MRWGKTGFEGCALEGDKCAVARRGREGVDWENEARGVGGSEAEASVRDKDVTRGEGDSRRLDVDVLGVIVGSVLAHSPVLAGQVVAARVEGDTGSLGGEVRTEESVDYSG